MRVIVHKNDLQNTESQIQMEESQNQNTKYRIALEWAIYGRIEKVFLWLRVDR